MVEYHKEGTYLINGALHPDSLGLPSPDEAREGTMAYKIMRGHDASGDKFMRLRFDAMMSHDITFVGIIQTARASGMKEFPIPYVLTNCHNSLCAVGGTINEDDHMFGLSAAKKYGGIYVPANMAVCHQFMRERLAGCGRMILGSDSHTRYGCYGTMGFGEGGGELAKQLLNNTYDIDAPQVVLIWLEGAPKKGVGPHDVAISLCGALFPDGLVKNKVMEFAGPGVAELSMDFRAGIDVMTTETSCLSSIWITDDKVKNYYQTIGRPEAFAELSPAPAAWYDAFVRVDLSAQECMIALPFHPSNACTIHELQANPETILKKAQDECNKSLSGRVELDLVSKIRGGRIYADQGVIVGCAGGLYDNITEAAAIMKDGVVGSGAFSLSVYPPSMPVSLAITRDGTTEALMKRGALIKSCFCGPCFGAGDTPASGALSIRHATRNFQNREGSRPGDGQIAAVALMDARSIAATALNGGAITAATDVDYDYERREYVFDPSPYESRVYDGFGKADQSETLLLGPNIADWPHFAPLGENMLLELCAVIRDDVTTTDELIPSGETSSYRSNPVRLSDFALSRRCPEYVPRSKAVRSLDIERRGGSIPNKMRDALSLKGLSAELIAPVTDFVSCVFAMKPGDGSAREQAASCQKVLGGGANICYEYATKRYRSNCINWGILPFTIDRGEPFVCAEGDMVFIPGVRDAVASGKADIPASLISGDKISTITLHLGALTASEREILLDGCLINWYGRGLGGNA